MRTRPHQTDDRKTDLLEYTLYNTFHFKPELSGEDLTGHEIITIPHPGNAFKFKNCIGHGYG